MKKLSKLKLRNFHEMNDAEMKRVVGGQYSGGPNGGCSCTGHGCAGSCPNKITGNYSTGFISIPMKCTSVWVHGNDFTNMMEVCECR